LSVYTPVSHAELAAWLSGYAVGALVALEPVAEGIENTNYFVTTEAGPYVLTLFERLPAKDLPFYLGLMAHLARHGVPCPAPVADLADRYFSLLAGKPAALVTRLPGRSVAAPTEAQCAALGALLARMHLAGRSYRGYLDNPRGALWRRAAAERLRARLDAERRALLEAELAYQEGQRFAELPRGPVHADLFRDNALFEGGRLSGVLDFYFAGVDALLFDLAVCANDWCLVDPQRDRRIDPLRLGAMAGAYARLRAFTESERAAWPAMLRAAALRFWLSRLEDLHYPRAGALVRVHDPEPFREILALRAATPAPPLP